MKSFVRDFDAKKFIDGFEPTGRGAMCGEHGDFHEKWKVINGKGVGVNICLGISSDSPYSGSITVVPLMEEVNLNVYDQKVIEFASELLHFPDEYYYGSALEPAGESKIYVAKLIFDDREETIYKVESNSNHRREDINYINFQIRLLGVHDITLDEYLLKENSSIVKEMSSTILNKTKVTDLSFSGITISSLTLWHYEEPRICDPVCRKTVDSRVFITRIEDKYQYDYDYDADYEIDETVVSDTMKHEGILIAELLEKEGYNLTEIPEPEPEGSLPLPYPIELPNDYHYEHSGIRGDYETISFKSNEYDITVTFWHKTNETVIHFGGYPWES
jgi:hypothetical protein